MTQLQKDEITKIAKEFFAGFAGDTMSKINGTGWLIVDPLSGFLNSLGFHHRIGQLPKNKEHPQVMVLTFPDGSRFIPAGADLKPILPQAENWLWC